MQEHLMTICGTEDRLSLILRGGNVLRYHAEGDIGPQSVAAHTWRLMVVLLHLWPNASESLLRTALYHDVPEGFVGDIPAPVKRHPHIKAAVDALEAEFAAYLQLPDERDLSEEDYLRFKISDYLELCVTCAATPGANAARIYATGKRYVLEYAKSLIEDEAFRVYEFIKKMEG